jgi:hypothetical protein
MIKTIYKGLRFSFPSTIGLHKGRTFVSKVVEFNDSCRYDLGDNDQDDWNKLFGFSYGYHHKNSLRVGWRYNKETSKIELGHYHYIHGERVYSKACDIDVNKEYIISLALLQDVETYFNVNAIQILVDGVIAGDGYYTDLKPSWGYKLGLYFGGNRVAPNKIQVKIKNI